MRKQDIDDEIGEIIESLKYTSNEIHIDAELNAWNWLQSARKSGIHRTIIDFKDAMKEAYQTD